MIQFGAIRGREGFELIVTAEGAMRPAVKRQSEEAAEIARGIRRAARPIHRPMVIAELHREESIAERCRKERTKQNLYIGG